MKEKNEMSTEQVETNPTGWQSLDEILQGEGDSTEAAEVPNQAQDQTTPESSSTETESATTATEETHDIRVTSLAEWLHRHIGILENLEIVRPGIEGVDFEKTILFAVTDSEGNRQIFLRKNADKFPVLNLEPQSMDIFESGSRIVYQQDDTMGLRCYLTRGGDLIVFSCLIDDDLMVPYRRVTIKRKDSGINLSIPAEEEIRNKLNGDVDLESLLSLYKQAEQFKDELVTTRDAVSWLSMRQHSLVDTVHLIRIDDVIRSLVS